ncbi:MAG: GNAT family N-acetyltransferase [Cyanobacteria bacterium]|nr:GNAT family N-acetyltransferase [Cyanobacteriota bacterium]
MFRDYQADIDVDLCFQGFEKELATLPGRYDCVLLAEGGCVALRPFGTGRVELKRLFVYPSFRGRGLGMALLQAAIGEARKLGYARMHLDTIPKKMPSAVRMYEALGFVRVPAGGGTNDPELLDMELDLQRMGFTRQGNTEQTSCT